MIVNYSLQMLLLGQKSSLQANDSLDNLTMNFMYIHRYKTVIATPSLISFTYNDPYWA